MGWTQYDRSVADPQGEIDRLYDCGTNKLIASRLVGNVHYAALEVGEPVEAAEAEGDD